MSNEINGGNNTDFGSSPEPAGESPEVDSVGSSANEPAMSARDFLSKRVEIRDKAAAKNLKPKTEKVVANESEEGSDEQDEASQVSKTADKKQVEQRDVNPKFQQRIDKLTARYHEAERKAAEKDVQIEKLMKATDILQKELERVSKFARLDPREEKIRELELQREVDQFTNKLSSKQEELYSKSVSEYQINSRADEILEEVSELVQEYDLVSPEEILLAMRDKNMTAAQAARTIHTARLQKASKKVNATNHPKTVSKAGAPSISPVDEPYRGAETIKKFFLQRMAERNGKAE